MADLTDADKVLRNDVGKSIVSKLDDIADAIVQHGGGAQSLGQLSDVDIDTTTLAEGQSIVYNPTTQKFENGEVSTVAALDDLTDVSITSAQKGDSLRNDGNGNWVNEPNTIAMTSSEWEAIADKAAWRNAHKNTHLVITDAPNLDETAKQISYDGGTDTVWDKVEDISTIVNGTIASGDIGANITFNRYKLWKCNGTAYINANITATATMAGTSKICDLPNGFGAGAGNTYDFNVTDTLGNTIRGYLTGDSISFNFVGNVQSGAVVIFQITWKVA